MSEKIAFSAIVRKSVLPFFGESIEYANQTAQDKWGVTPYLPDGVRLNVGFCEALTVQAQEVRVLVDVAVAAQCESVKIGLLKLESGPKNDDYYPSAPGSRLVTLHTDEGPDRFLFELRKAHHQHIHNAATRTFNRGSKEGHQNWAVEAIASELNKPLPLPSYSLNPKQESETKASLRNWTRDELKASVEAYLEMRFKAHAGEEFNKKQYYRDLSQKFGRSEKAYEYRMQNISYVLSLAGREWITGLLPASNVGASVAAQIEDILAEIEKRPIKSIVEFQAKVQASRKTKNIEKPSGVREPKTVVGQSTQYQRDDKVVAWVLNESKGTCECCRKAAPFLTSDGTPFLEVHHVRQLADEGPDMVENAVALCPNCHREIHHGANSKKLVEHLYSTVARLVR